MLYKVILTFVSVDNISVTIQMKATEQHFPAVLFIMLYRVVLTFEAVEKKVNRDGELLSSTFICRPFAFQYHDVLQCNIRGDLESLLRQTGKRELRVYVFLKK